MGIFTNYGSGNSRLLRHENVRGQRSGLRMVRRRRGPLYRHAHWQLEESIFDDIRTNERWLYLLLRISGWLRVLLLPIVIELLIRTGVRRTAGRYADLVAVAIRKARKMGREPTTEREMHALIVAALPDHRDIRVAVAERVRGICSSWKIAF